MSPIPQLLSPLRSRDFALLSAGSAVSLLGDGVLFVAIAVQVYQLSNVPTALSLVGLSWTLPMVLLLLVGGAASDRFERRRVMILADLVRATAIGIVGILSVSARLELWHLFVLTPFLGAGTAFFGPASVAIVPEVVPAGALTQANALGGALRSLMLQILGPAAGGLVVALAGPGPAILFDAASFLFSAVALSRMHAGPPPVAVKGSGIREILEGVRYSVKNVWIGATLLGYSVGIMASRGPTQVLLPYAVKDSLHAGAPALGFILAAVGVGAVAASLLAGRRQLPRREVAVMCAVWAASFLGIALYGLMSAVWEGVAIGFALGGLHAYGIVIWYTLLQRRVPRALLGRVSSVDAMVSYALLPLSFALTASVAAAAGLRVTFIAAGILGGIGMAAPLIIPAMRAPRYRGCNST